MSIFPEFSPIHPGYPARHVPAPPAHLWQARGQAGHPQRQRVLQDIRGEPPEEVQAGRQTLQGRQGQGKFHPRWHRNTGWSISSWTLVWLTFILAVSPSAQFCSGRWDFGRNG